MADNHSGWGGKRPNAGRKRKQEAARPDAAPARRGRPTNADKGLPRTLPVAFRLPEAQYRLLEALAQQAGYASPNEYAGALLRERLAQSLIV